MWRVEGEVCWACCPSARLTERTHLALDPSDVVWLYWLVAFALTIYLLTQSCANYPMNGGKRNSARLNDVQSLSSGPSPETGVDTDLFSDFGWVGSGRFSSIIACPSPRVSHCT